MTIYFHELAWPDIAEAAKRDTLIILPTGQVEQHGPQLPVETDCIIARETAKAVAHAIKPEIPVLVLPTVWTAYSVRQIDQWPGLISFRQPETMIQMIYDILASMVRNGFRKIVIINSHGNNPAILELACRRIGDDHDVFPAITYVLGMTSTIGPKVRKSKMGGCGGHAGEEETALILHLAPHLVRMDRATDEDIVRYQSRFFPGDIYSNIPNRPKGVYWSTWGVAPSKTGVYGDPTAATAATGKALFNEAVRNYVEFIREFYHHQTTKMRPAGSRATPPRAKRRHRKTK
ncbi:creatininase family protein [bacterium]|nr:creatininase family protein [bacterium]